MKTLHPVDEATKAKIGKAYAICSEYPDVFGDVTFEKFCSMFVDVIPEGESERSARMKAYAGEMYDTLYAIAQDMARREYCIDFDCCEDYASKMSDLIDRVGIWRIDGE